MAAIFSGLSLGLIVLVFMSFVLYDIKYFMPTKYWECLKEIDLYFNANP